MLSTSHLVAGTVFMMVTMSFPPAIPPIRVAIVGAGAISEFQHVPGLQLDPRAELVAVCDVDSQRADLLVSKWGGRWMTTDFHEVCHSSDVDALIIATPNDTHAPITIAAVQQGKHVLCEKPLGRTAAEVRSMVQAAHRAGVVHMTGFTYRFAPAMRYLRHLLTTGALGQPRHFRSQRFLDLPETSWGWRQVRDRAGAGNLFDMTIHRIDLALDLLGPLTEVCGDVRQFARRTLREDGSPCPASEVDDWSAIIGHFESGAVGVWEGTTLAKGHHHGGFGHEWAEINGSEASAVYRLHQPNQLWRGSPTRDLTPEEVPAEFLTPAGSPRDPKEGVPAVVFRYDVVWEFISAILEPRSAVPDFCDGLAAQLVADAVLQSHRDRRWVTIPTETRP